MNKDAILATVIGFGVGLVIAGLVFLGPSLLSGLPHFKLPNFSFLKNTFGTTRRLQPTPTGKPASHTFSITSPLPDSVEPRNETLISGTTTPNATVVLEGEIGESVVVANSEGSYAGKLSLGEGKNDLLVTSYSGKDVQTLPLTVYYTTENF
jgi:hypothetical protein